MYTGQYTIKYGLGDKSSELCVYTLRKLYFSRYVYVLYYITPFYCIIRALTSLSGYSAYNNSVHFIDLRIILYPLTATYKYITPFV